MRPKLRVRRCAYLLPLSLLVTLSCSTSKPTRTYKEPPPPGIHSTTIAYADADAFDTLLESTLVNQDPVIVITTEYQKPEWGPRLDAWIAAWNRGGKVADGDGRRVRGQSPLSPVVVNEGSLKEFRLLIGGFMNRVEDLARGGSAWWAEEKVKSRRIALLRPYNLRFHLDEKGNIQLILFNGRYSQYYGEFMQSIAQADADHAETWQRQEVSCSRCKGFHFPGEIVQPQDEIRLTKWTEAP